MVVSSHEEGIVLRDRIGVALSGHRITRQIWDSGSYASMGVLWLIMECLSCKNPLRRSRMNAFWIWGAAMAF